MMSRLGGINFVVPIISLGLAFIMLLIPITETNSAQVIMLQPLYSILDKSWLLFRSLVFFLFSIAAIIVLSRNAQTLRINGTLRYFVVIGVPGLLASLVIFYGFSCCDSPVVFFMGFPFSWLRGITPAQHYLPLPAFQYLMMNFSQFNWDIEAFSLITNILFWHNVSLLVVISKQQGWLILQKRSRPQNTQ
ncbi:MAG: hypothetical protein ROW48_17365 [Bellilinea sp.]